MRYPEIQQSASVESIASPEIQQTPSVDSFLTTTGIAVGVPHGYKRTDVGLMPEDWKVARIGDNTSIKTGSKNTQDKQDNGDYPFFVRSQEIESINSYSYDGEAVLTAGDGVGTGKVFHYINGRFDLHQRVYRIADFSYHLNGRYFFYHFSAHFYDRIMSMTAKSSVDSVRLDVIADMQIPLPPLLEQRAIAEALSDVDDLLAALEALIAKKRAIKQAAMQQLLTGKTRLPGFSGEWETKRLGELGTFGKGRGVRREDISFEGLPCVLYGELYTRYHNYTCEISSHIPREVAQGALPIEAGDILFAASGETAQEIGRCVSYLGRESAYVGGDIIVLRPSGQDPIYLGHLLNHPTVQAEKARMGQGNTVVHISTRSLAQVEINLPLFKEQSAIAAVLSDMDSELSGLEQRRDKTRAIKWGMMQDLLTGRVRLFKPDSTTESSPC